MHKVGLQNDVHTLKRLSLLSYHELAQFDIPSYYKLGAISKAAGILSNRKQSIKRRIKTKDPYMNRSILFSCYRFKIVKGVFMIPLGSRRYFEIPLNQHTQETLDGNKTNPTFKVNSFVLTADRLSISYSKDMPEIDYDSTAWIDRNLRNVTVGDCIGVVQYDISKVITIAENTRSILSSFKRNDHRIRKKLYLKYGSRKRNKTRHLLHKVSKDIVQKTSEKKQALVFEDIRHIKRMYCRGNGQGKNHRYVMNNWLYSEVKRQIEYKAKWKGVRVIQLSKKETRGTSKMCPICGKRLQDGGAFDKEHKRDLWCERCGKWRDRDVVAVMNQSLRGLSKFDSSKGDANEARRGNVDDAGPLILRVDASKLYQRRIMSLPAVQSNF